MNPKLSYYALFFICSYLILIYDDYCSLYVQWLTSLVAVNVCLYSSKLNPELLSSPQDWTTNDPSACEHIIIVIIDYFYSNI